MAGYTLENLITDTGSLVETYGPDLVGEAAPFLETGVDLLSRLSSSDPNISNAALEAARSLVARASAGDQSAILAVGALDSAYRASAAGQSVPVSGYLVTAGGRILTGQFVQVR